MCLQNVMIICSKFVGNLHQKRHVATVVRSGNHQSHKNSLSEDHKVKNVLPSGPIAVSPIVSQNEVMVSLLLLLLLGFTPWAL